MSLLFLFLGVSVRCILELANILVLASETFLQALCDNVWNCIFQVEEKMVETYL